MGTGSAQTLDAEEVVDQASAHASEADAASDPIADRLSLAIDRASEAGQWTVVERLAEQLERHQVRQLEVRSENVTRLPIGRKKPGAS